MPILFRCIGLLTNCHISLQILKRNKMGRLTMLDLSFVRAMVRDVYDRVIHKVAGRRYE